jgi:hypothetical protein
MIRATATAVNPTGTFVNAQRRSDASLCNDKPSPQIFLLRVGSSRRMGESVRRWSCTLLFVTQDTPETDEDKREQIKADMDQLSTSFYNHLVDNNDVEVSVTGTPEDRILQGTYSGWGAAFEITTPITC